MCPRACATCGGTAHHHHDIREGTQMKRLFAFLALTLLLLLPTQLLAAQYTVSVNQFVEHPALDAVLKGFQDNATELGMDVTYNVHIAQANMGTTTQIANQIMGEKPDLVLAIATPSAQACAQKIKDIPILATAVTDFVSAGLVSDVLKPGANLSGMTDMSPVAEQVALIKEFLPEIKTLGVIYNSGEANSVVVVDILKAEAEKLGITVEEATVVNSSGVYQAAKSLVGKAEAVYIPTDNTVVSALESAIKVCTETKLPLFAADNDSVERGVIASLAVDYYRMGRQTAEMAKRILVDGAKPADMPVESLANLMLYINPGAAEAMGMAVPETVTQRADKVIE
jgi:putative tryptophan/tyrosine transport system substrate-binding protein